MKKMVFGAALFLGGVLLLSAQIIGVWDTRLSIVTILIGLCGAGIMAYEAFFTTDLRANNTAYFKEWAWGCTTVESQKLYRYPIMAFRDDPSLTVEQYQAGMVNRYSNWDTILK